MYNYWAKFIRNAPQKNRPLAVGEWINTKYGRGKIVDIEGDINNQVHLDNRKICIIVSVALPYREGIFKFRFYINPFESHSSDRYY